LAAEKKRQDWPSVTPQNFNSGAAAPGEIPGEITGEITSYGELGDNVPTSQRRAR